jgi:hypothetical protein
MFDYGKRFKKGFFHIFSFYVRCVIHPCTGLLTTLVDFGVADPDPGCIFWIIFPRALETIFWVKILEFFDADSDPGSGNFFDPESGMEKFRFWIRDKHPESATVVDSSKFLLFSQADNGECYFPPFVGLRLLF